MGSGKRVGIWACPWPTPLGAFGPAAWPPSPVSPFREGSPSDMVVPLSGQRSQGGGGRATRPPKLKSLGKVVYGFAWSPSLTHRGESKGGSPPPVICLFFSYR